MNDEITVLDLFSGIGGFSLGLESAGPFRTIAFCEQDKFCQAVLRKHWPSVPIFDDVRTIPTDGLGRIDIIAGGWPCQPWSQAGQRRGAEDDRDLWPEVARLVGELRPRWLVGENVRGFVNQPMGLQRSLSDLESLGYQTVPFIIPACAVDAPHRRDRVWIIAHANGKSEPDGTVDEGTRSGELVADAECGRPTARKSSSLCKTNSHNEKSNGAKRVVKSRAAGISEAVADASVQPTRGAQRGEHNKGRRPDASRSSEIVADAGSARREGACRRGETETERASEGHTSECDGWLSEPGMGGMANGVPRWLDEPDCGRVASGVKNRVPRLKALGNAVVPQVVEQIGRAILAAECAG